MAFQMPDIQAPCQDCTERFVGCHSTCEKYAKYVKDRNKLRHELKKKVYEEKNVHNYVIDAVYRAQGKKKLMK